MRSKRMINLKEPEMMDRKIKQHILEKEEKRKNEIISREILEMKECTFQPNLPYNKYNNSSIYSGTIFVYSCICVFLFIFICLYISKCT
jgi:hypothetical protein